MSKAFKCDRCHGYEEGTPVLRVTTKTCEPPTKEKDHELCPQCLASLHDWLGAAANPLETNQ